MVPGKPNPGAIWTRTATGSLKGSWTMAKARTGNESIPSTAPPSTPGPRGSGEPLQNHILTLDAEKSPLLDRIDLHVEVPAQPPESLHGGEPGEPTTVLRARVEAARGCGVAGGRLRAARRGGARA